ncbi:MAG: sortase-like acyltransferase [Herbinix sp.]|jgi:phosphinothricin acetyltransferase|nr:sortase-like acyltransferase [Herbinix sp.]
MSFSIEKMHPEDWPQVSEIYLTGIRTGIATFQSDVPTWEEWNKSHSENCRFVARSGNAILGWIALTPISGRCVYAGVAEVSIYISEESRNQGVGTELLAELIWRSEEAGYWTLQAAIIKDNIASRELFRKCGFREIGFREKLGKMADGKWYDVVMVEKRSTSVGI